MSDFHSQCKKYLEDEGYRFLGDEFGMVFFKDSKGEIFGAAEDQLAIRMKEKGYWTF